ncbi:MAG TPA: poly-gamma-glutamate hydrolase family protein [Nitrososphaeraceae archaeon]|nr:poly-gamma-glutamate hydrolase family protein [Nitrososphaeraceae archaeon]
MPTEEPFQGKINPQVAAVGLSEDDAKAYNEFIEELTDDGYNTELVVIAPHGGDIEEHTDEQAEEVAKQILPSKCVSLWMCKGFNKKEDGGAFARWHITSTDISEESFPKLKTIIGRQFKYAIAFHGWNGEKNSICIGGTIPYDLKCEIKRAIADAISGSGIVVAIGGDYYSDDKTCPENFNGNNSNNIVNRLSPNGGVQIEQSKKAREEYSPKIAEAVADVIRPKLAV